MKFDSAGGYLYSYIARQPILNQKQELVAYELLFRDGLKNSFPDINPDQATSNILTNNHLTLGVEEVTGDLPAYINFHADALIKHFPSFLDPKKVVIEILEDVPISDKLLAACKNLKAKGYKLALDDHNFDPKWKVFFPYVDMIKVDVLDFNILEISRFVRDIQEFDITLVAEKVETAEQFEKLKLLGFEYFQGYFFAKPETLKQKKLSTTKQNILELVSHASKVHLDFDDMSAIFAGDPSLTYKLLRFINSPAYGCTQEITSLKHALIFIGDLELKKFIALLALSDLNNDKPSEIVTMSLVRAKFCEQISNHLRDNENPPKAFLTGILSLIDGILDHTLTDVLKILPVHADIKRALVKKDNYLAHYLALAKLIEVGDWHTSHQICEQLGVSTNFCHEAHRLALEWADGMLK